MNNPSTSTRWWSLKSAADQDQVHHLQRTTHPVDVAPDCSYTNRDYGLLSLSKYDKEVRKCRTGAATWEPVEHIAKWKLRPFTGTQDRAPASTSSSSSRPSKASTPQRREPKMSMRHLPCRFWEKGEQCERIGCYYGHKCQACGTKVAAKHSTDCSQPRRISSMKVITKTGGSKGGGQS